MSEIPPPTGSNNVVNYGGAPSDPRQLVNLPAIFLIVVGAIGAAGQLLAIAFNALGVGLNAAGGGRGGAAAMMQGGAGIFFGIIGIIVAGLIIFGAIKMRKLQNYGLAMTAAIIAMIPCISPCCLLGLPIGIWALVVLLKPEVKAGFQSNTPQGFPPV